MIRINNTDLWVSELCLGTVNFGTRTTDEEAMHQLDLFTGQGGNFIDTAHVYGDWGTRGRGLSERIIGEWLKTSGKRQEMVLCTKGGHPRLESMATPRLRREEILLDVEESLQCLQTDVIDLYLLHRDDPSRPVAELLAPLEEARKRGSIRYYGCSNWSLDRMIEARQAADEEGFAGFSVNQTMWSLADISRRSIKDPTLVPMDQAMYSWHAKTGLSVMAYMGAAKGYFTKLEKGLSVSENLSAMYDTPASRTIASLLKNNLPEEFCATDAAMLYFRGQPFTSIPLASFSTDAQLLETMNAFKKEFPKDLWNELNRTKQFLV